VGHAASAAADLDEADFVAFVGGAEDVEGSGREDASGERGGLDERTAREIIVHGFEIYEVTDKWYQQSQNGATVVVRKSWTTRMDAKRVENVAEKNLVNGKRREKAGNQWDGKEVFEVEKG
jgi:hypothetical protein